MKPLFFNTPFSGRISIPTSFVSLFIFYIFSYLLLKTMGCLSGCLMSSVSIQKLFCRICSAFKCSFSEFVGRESGLPVLFLCHLRTTASLSFLKFKVNGGEVAQASGAMGTKWVIIDLTHIC